MSGLTTPHPDDARSDGDAAGGSTADRLPAAAEAMAIRAVPAHLRFWCVVAGGLTLDLWSKHWAFHTLGQSGQRELIRNVFELHCTLNPGALFGLGGGQTMLFVLASVVALALVIWMFAQCPARRWLTQVALGAILAGALGNMYDRVFVRLVPFQFATPGGAALRYCVTDESLESEQLTLREYPPVEGGLASVVPRSIAGQLPAPVGYVRDFIKISQKWFGGRDVWPWVFNVADMLLVGGVGILAVRLLRERQPAAAAEQVNLDAAGKKS